MLTLLFCKQDESFLILLLRKEEWASAWDTMITSCYKDRNTPTFEKDYELKVRHELDVHDEEDDGEEDDEKRITSRMRRMRKKMTSWMRMTMMTISTVVLTLSSGHTEDGKTA
jgi:hypothetical protein